MSEDPEAGVLGHEVSVKDEDHNVSGRADTLVRTEHGVEVIELKTIDSNAFFHSNLPYESALEQLAVYLAFESEFGPAVEGHIVYIGKQDGKIREFDIEATPELAEYIKGHLKSLEEQFVKYRDAGEMPAPIKAPATDSRLMHCEYKKTGLCCGDKKPVQGALLEETA